MWGWRVWKRPLLFQLREAKGMGRKIMKLFDLKIMVGFLVLFLLFGCTSDETHLPNTVSPTPPTKEISESLIVTETIVENQVTEEEYSYDIFWTAPDGCDIGSLSPNYKWMVTDCDGTAEFAKGTWIFSLTGIEEPRQISEEPIPYKYWAPDGSMFVTRDIDAPVTLYFVDDLSKPDVIFPNHSRVYGNPIWAPNSKSFVIRNWLSDTPSLSRFQLDGSVNTIIEGWDKFHLPTFYPADPVWTSDSQQIIYSGVSDPEHKHGQIWTLNPNSGKQKLLLETDEPLYKPVLSPNDKLIALQNAAGHSIHIFDIENTTLKQIPQEFQNTTHHYTWSPNSKYLFIEDLDSLWILTLDNFTLQEKPRDSYIWWSVWSPDSKHLAARDESGIWILSLEDFSRELLIQFPQTDDKALIKYLYGWTEDGKALLVSFPEENALKIVPIQSD